MTFLRSHLREMVAIDFFIVPTARFNLLSVFVVLAHFRRQVVHFNVTTNPTAEWAAQQIVEAFPWDEAPGHILRDRHGTYGGVFRKRVRHMGIQEVLAAPWSPWQNPCVERLIGSVRRECLDNVIILNERHPRRVLKSYFDYHQQWRTHLSLAMDCSQPGSLQRPTMGRRSSYPRSVVSTIIASVGQPDARWPDADRARSAAQMSFRERQEFPIGRRAPARLNKK